MPARRPGSARHKNSSWHSLALARRMAGRKKGEASQLQIEVTTEDEWKKLLAKEGLVVVDVYSGWCGPCVGMLGNLKKIKLEIGGDLLHLAIARADGIEALSRFRNKSEPTWMFIASGNMVNLMFGANAPRLSRMIIDELNNETEVLKGNKERETIPFHELTPEEVLRKEEEEKRRQEAIAAEEEALATRLNELRLLSLARRDVEPLHIILLPPHTVAAGSDKGAWHETTKAITAADALVLEEHEISLDPETACETLMLGETGSEGRREWCIVLQTGPCVALLVGINPIVQENNNNGQQLQQISSTEQVETTNEIEKSKIDILYESLGPTTPENGYEDSVSVKYRDGIHIPGVWAPQDHEICSAAICLFFPELATPTGDDNSGDGGAAPVEVTVGVFPADKQQSILEVLQSCSDRMLAVTLRNITNEQAEQISSELATNLSGERLVVALRTDEEHNSDILTNLDAIYVSEDSIKGGKDFQLLFPPSDDTQEIEVEN